jgi:hypothetical protein
VACQNRLVGGDGFNNVPVPLQLLAQEAATAVLETTVWCIRVAKDRNDAMVKGESDVVFFGLGCPYQTGHGSSSLRHPRMECRIKRFIESQHTPRFLSLHGYGTVQRTGDAEQSFRPWRTP